MAHHNNQGFVCGDCDCDCTVSTSTSNVELDNFDQLLTLLLSVRTFLQCSLFPSVFRSQFNLLLDHLSDFRRVNPYRPPSVELVDAIKKFVAQVRANKSLLDRIVASTRAGLSELSVVVKDF